MNDWSGWMLEVSRHTRKAGEYLVATRSCGPEAERVALEEAQRHLLEARAAARAALATIRERQTRLQSRNSGGYTETYAAYSASRGAAT